MPGQAFGRYGAEAVFWSPAALLPEPDVSWSEVSQRVARVTVKNGGVSQSVDLTVRDDGRPVQVLFFSVDQRQSGRVACQKPGAE